jgi:uncharacterized peroxidase-related enzyme
MNRLQPLDPGQATGKTKQLFDAIASKLGFIPNMMRVIGHSPAALQGYLGLSTALASGVLPPKVREHLALAISEINGCDYCLSAHTVYAAKAGLTPEEILAARRATSSDPKTDAILKFARALALQRGNLTDSDLHAARRAGLTDAEIVEVIQHVALNTLTNYTNLIARTAIDFPPVKSTVTAAMELAA